jgi:hypothetical protein
MVTINKGCDDDDDDDADNNDHDNGDDEDNDDDDNITNTSSTSIEGHYTGGSSTQTTAIGTIATTTRYIQCY